MEIRIGIAESPQVIEIDMADGTDLDDVKGKVESAMGGKLDVVWFEDRKQRQIAVPAARMSFVEINPSEAERRIGFGA